MTQKPHQVIHSNNVWERVHSFHWLLKTCGPWEEHNHKTMSIWGTGPGLSQYPPLFSRVRLSLRQSHSRTPGHQGFVTKISLCVALLPVLKQVPASCFRDLLCSFCVMLGWKKGGPRAHLEFSKGNPWLIYPRKMSSHVRLPSLLWEAGRTAGQSQAGAGRELSPSYSSFYQWQRSITVTQQVPSLARWVCSVSLLLG